jgi:hypothetical protein
MSEMEAAPEQGMDLDSIAANLKRQYDNADQYSMQLAGLQAAAVQYYEADIVTFPSREGGSQIILPDVQEVVDYMTGAVLRLFLSGQNAVELEAVEEEAEEGAHEATEALNYNFLRQQDGARILHDGLVDGLLKKIGVFKTAVETVEKVSRETLQFASEEEIALYAEQTGCDVEGVQQLADGSFAAACKRQIIEKRFVDYAVPVSRFKFTPTAKHEDDADYLCHDELKTRSELVEMGFDRDQVYSLPAYGNRYDWRDNESNTLDNQWRDSVSAELEEVLLCHEFARMDVDGDGIAERVEVYRVENDILIDAETGEPSIETVEEQPFSVFCPFPRPHHMVGYSLADKVMDIQLTRSFFARQLADGMAFSNMPRPVVDTNMADADTWDDILTPIPGSPIRVKGGTAAVQPFQTGFNAGQSLQVMEWLAGERESRTGITRLNQGIDADALNKTATGTALMQAQGQQQEEMIGRQLAQTLGRLFLKKYRLMKAEGGSIRVKVDGQFREVDPSQWPEEVNVIVRVGLGTGSKDKRIQYRMALAPLMQEGIAAGKVSDKNAFNMIDGLVRDMGIGSGDDYWIDPDSEEGQQHAAQMAQQPNPEMAKVQLEAEKANAQLQLEGQKSQAQLDAMREKHALEMAQKREAAELEAMLAREKADTEAQIALYKIDKEAEIARHQMMVKGAVDTHIAENRPGGDLDK